MSPDFIVVHGGKQRMMIWAHVIVLQDPINITIPDVLRKTL